MHQAQHALTLWDWEGQFILKLTFSYIDILAFPINSSLLYYDQTILTLTEHLCGCIDSNVRYIIGHESESYTWIYLNRSE